MALLRKDSDKSEVRNGVGEANLSIIAAGMRITGDLETSGTLKIDGRIVHQVGLPYHWGTSGLVTGDSVNDLVAISEELGAAGGSLRFVQKYGFTTRNIDESACAQAGIRVLTIRRRANISTAEQALMLMLALARQVTQNVNLISVEQLTAAGYQPTTYQRQHTPNGNWARMRCRLLNSLSGIRQLNGSVTPVLSLIHNMPSPNDR